MVIQVLETMTKEQEKNREKSWLCAANTSSVWVHRTVRCARLVRGELAALGTRRRRTTKIHRTVRWCTGLSGESSAANSSLSGNQKRQRGYNSLYCPVVHRTVR
jgi:hypothetical protein